MPERELSEQLDQAIDVLLAGGAVTVVDPPLPGLTAIANTLRDMPDERFIARLERELQTGRKPMHPAIHKITPFLCVPEGDKLIEFMKHTLDAEETGRHAHHGPDGFVAGVRIGDSDLIVMSGESYRGQESLAALHVYVKDCDAAYQRAIEAGAVTIGGGFGQPADRPYGERAAFVSDPLGNKWFIATRLGADYVGVGLKHVNPSLLPTNAAPLIDFLKRAFDAEMEGVREVRGRMIFAFVRIGEAIVEMAESDEQQSRPFGFYMYTDDVDAVYERAVAAGAVSIVPPADQPFGDRLAIVQDPAGNRWFAAKPLSPRRGEGV